MITNDFIIPKLSKQHQWKLGRKFEVTENMYLKQLQGEQLGIG